MSENAKKDILEFLKSHQIMVLSTIDSENHPQIAPVIYMVDDTFTISFVTHSDSRKAQNIQANSAVAISVWEHDVMSLQIEGVARLVSDKKNMPNLLEELTRAAERVGPSFHPPILRLQKESNYAVFTVKINRIQQVDLSDPFVQEHHSALQVISF